MELKHAHGTDCCWDCFAGYKAHPREDNDSDCRERSYGDGAECIYAIPVSELVRDWYRS